MANLIEHKRVHFDYEILEQFEAGVQLFGTEVKSLRAHQGKLEGGHITVRGGEAFLINAEIPPFKPQTRKVPMSRRAIADYCSPKRSLQNSPPQKRKRV